MRISKVGIAFVLTAALGFVSIIVHAVPISNLVFATRLGYGPDKWASVWLLEKLEHETRILRKNVLSEKLVNVIYFDIQNSEFTRSESTTTYAQLLSEFSRSSNISKKVGEILYEIEIDAFSQSISQEARIVEHGFRGMQLRYGRDQVTKACYLHFFDNVAAAIETDGLATLKSKDLIPESACMDDKSGMPSEEPISVQVPTLDLHTAFESYAQKDNIVFVDTRETWEYEEGRIPGAINIKLREVENSLDLVRDADLVIAYCVKDFRGYEAARAFRKHGINAAIMKPHGMRGWIEEGLPVAGSKGLPEAEALVALQTLAETSVMPSQ